MLKNETIICISSIDWDFIWQGHQEIMSTFAKNGNIVLFIENTGIRPPNFKDIIRLKNRVINWLNSTRGFREADKNLYIYSPLILPFPYSVIARWVNRRILKNSINRWMKIMGLHNPIIWTFLPTGTALDIIDAVDKKLLVYYCIADFSELANDPKKVRKAENEIIRRADLVFAQGEVIQKRCAPLNNNVHIFPFGVRMENFDAYKCTADKVPEDMKGIRTPVIGYIGGVHKHVDLELLRYIAERHPEWSIALVGPLQTEVDKIKWLKNMFLLGKKDFKELPYYINKFDVCIIPYTKSEYTETVYPTKLNEYHALGKPVVSIDLPEVIKFNRENDGLVLIAKTYREFVDCISYAIDNSNSELSNKRISVARKNNWGTRIEAMSELIQSTINKKVRTPVNWRQELLGLYKAAKKKTYKFIGIFLALYLLIFYTPFIWFIAEPLKIVEKPQEADAIVVFAGGVGESGKAGQGYEERVQQAVNLYKEGYAKNIIFSSGYMYIYKEPLLMKALAVSLGVPEGAITLEDQAGSTYKNVDFTVRILKSKGWNKILLVTSPYHMRRASLVFKKAAKEMTVIYTPVQVSLFYSYDNTDISAGRKWKAINLEQLRSILHEYLGILYYYWKGYA